MADVSKKEFLNNLVQVEWKHYKNQIYGNDEMEARYSFAERRINQKYIQLYWKYEKIHYMDWETMFNECQDIIIDIVNSMDKDYIYISKKEKKDDISYIITTLEQRIDDKVNLWTGAYRDRSGGKDEIANVDVAVYLDEVLYVDEDGKEVTKGELISTEDIITKQSKSNEEIDRALEKIYKKAKLTPRQIEVLQALERTEDNYANDTIYTRVDAAKILGTTDSNIRKTFHTIKNKVTKAYDGQVPSNANKRQDTIIELETFLDSIEDEKDVIEFINANLEKEFILYILYESDLDSELVRYYNLNKNNDSTSDTMRKFCTYFLRELYDYIDLLKYNDAITNKVKRLLIKTEPRPDKHKDFIDNTVHTYIREDKATLQQKQNRYITIDQEKYYLTNDITNDVEDIFF